MTKPRDPEALLSAFLDDGMQVLPDRVVESVLAEVHRTRQRAVVGPWRTRSMLRSAFGAAAMIAVLVSRWRVLRDPARPARRDRSGTDGRARAPVPASPPPWLARA